MKGKLISIIIGLSLSGNLHADMFGTGTNQFAMDFVNIGYAGNSADSTGYGAVGYNYRIGRTEVSIDQFMKVRAMDNRVGSGDENAWNTGFRSVGINAPASEANWVESAMFCNWLTTGDAYTGIYQFNGSGVFLGIDRSYRNGSGMAYMLPSENEWYKAAYFKNDGSGYSLYASGLDTQPVHGTASGWNYFSLAYGGFVNTDPNRVWEVDDGGLEQNGTYNMMGNVEEWVEEIFDDNINVRTSRGGGYTASTNGLGSLGRQGGGIDASVGPTFGFRVVAIPEPSSVLLLMMGSGSLLFYRRAQLRHKENLPPTRKDFS